MRWNLLAVAACVATAGGLAVLTAQRSPAPAMVLTDRSGLTASLGADGVVTLGGEPLFEVAAVEQAGEAQTRGEPRQARARHQRTWGDLVEVLEPLASGFEHSFVVNQRPRGPLTVTLRPRGLLAFATDRLTFSGSPGAFEARAPVWVDADGQRTELSYEQHQDVVRVRVPEAVLQRSRFPAVLDPWLGQAQAVDAPVIGHAFGMQAFTKMARGGDGRSLLVWVDFRSGRDFDLLARCSHRRERCCSRSAFPSLRCEATRSTRASSGTERSTGLCFSTPDGRPFGFPPRTFGWSG